MKRFTLLPILLSLVACSSKPTATPSISPVSESSPSPSPSAKEFKPKPLAVRGTTQQQLADQTLVLQLIVAGKPEDLDKIPQTSQAGVTPNPLAVFEGVPPKGTDVCNIPYYALIKAMYEQCLKEGMSYNRVASIIGAEGEESARSGSTVTYSWKGTDKGTMSATFIDDKLTSKAQQGLN